VTTTLFVRDLAVTYDNGPPAVSGYSVDLMAGTLTVILGRNGAGKTSTLRGITGFLAHESGSVRGTIALDGVVVRRPNPLRLSRLGVGLVAERDKVFANMSVYDQMRLVMSARDVAEHIRPLLLCMATDVTYCGPAGSGQIVKQLNNMVLFQNVLAIAEAHAVATAAGLDGTLLFDALSKGSADSFALRNHGMKAILSDEYPLNAFSTDYALKDLSYALEVASATGVAAQGAELVRRVLEATREAGWGNQYFPVLRRTIGPAKGTAE